MIKYSKKFAEAVMQAQPNDTPINLHDEEKRCYGNECHNKERCGRHLQIERDRQRVGECVVVVIMKHCRDEWGMYQDFVPENL